MGYYQDIKNTFGVEATMVLKKWSVTSGKIARLTNRKNFLLQCRRHNLLPNHVIHGSKNITSLLVTKNQKLSRKAAILYDRLGHRVLNLEISITLSDLEFHSNQLTKFKQTAFNLIPIHVYDDFDKTTTSKFNRIFNQIKRSNLNKFNLLTSKAKKDKLYKDNSSWFVDRTIQGVPTDVGDFLSLGPKFGVPFDSNEVDISNLVAECELILDSTVDADIDIRRAKVTNILTNYFTNSQQQAALWADTVGRCRKFLKNNPNIVILKADKGSVTVAMEKTEYICKTEELLTDSSTYKMVDTDPTQSVQFKLNELLKTLKRNNEIDEVLYKKLSSFNSVCAKLYTLPKIHKPEIPVRPIVSCINSPTYDVSAFVAGLLTVCFKNHSSYDIQDSFTFVDIYQNFKLPDNYCLISLDVVSLFTNIPSDLVFHILHINWSLISEHTNLCYDSFFELIQFILNNSYFSFNNNYYFQTSGIPMGSPLSPALANIVMDYCLDCIVRVLPFQFAFIRKYVDDIICALPQSEIQDTLDTFNSFHPNIQFTVEVEVEGGVPFLDTRLIRNNNVITIDWYQKRTNSGRFLNFNSCHPIRHKLNTLIGMKNRVSRISHPSFLQKNLQILKCQFINNGYPASLVNKILFSTSTLNGGVAQSMFARGGDSNTSRYFRLPFIPNITNRLTRAIKQDHDDINFGYYSYKPIQKFFTNVKDKTDLLSKSNLIYSIPCIDCPLHYIGQTSSWLKTRLTLHKSDLNTKKTRCALSTHCLNNNHKPDFENVKVLRNVRNKKCREFLEMVEINKQNNVMNFRSDIDSLNKIYSFLLSLNHKYQNHNFTINVSI